MALTLSCAGSAILSSAYFVIWCTRKNDPTMTVTPIMDALYSLTTDPGSATQWIIATQPNPTHGTWNAAVTYSIGDTVASALYRIQSPDGVTTNYPITYKSMRSFNQGHSPENWDGWWACVTGPPGGTTSADSGFGVVPFGYLLSPLPAKSDVAGSNWTSSLWHSLFTTTTPPGDVFQLIDVYVKLNYLVGTVIESTISRPLTHILNTTGVTTGLITNPGVNAQFQCWHTSGLANFPSLELNGFDTTAFVDGMQPNATVGANYLAALAASGGTAPYSYGIIAGGLPPGITLNGHTGVISGIPTASGVFDFTAQVTDATGATATVTCGHPVGCAAGAAGNAFY